VDDEEKVLTSLRRGLLGEPYEILFAQSGKEALEILQRNPVQVLVSDMRMPEMSGLELQKTVKQRYPYIIRMILSGYTDTEELLGLINQGEIFRFICKPWHSNEEFKTTIRQAIEFYNLYSEREMLMHFFELWVEGVEAEFIDIEFLKELVASRGRHLYEWRRSCNSVGLEPS